MTRFTFLLLILLMMACTPKLADTSSPPSNWLTKIKLSDLDGKAIDLQQYKGKTVFINFWATWCRPCLEELPSLAHAQELLTDKNIVFLFASDEELSRIESFQKKSKWNLTFVRVTNFDDLAIQVLPTTYIINEEGTLSFSESGSRKWDDPASIELITQTLPHE